MAAILGGAAGGTLIADIEDSTAVGAPADVTMRKIFVVPNATTGRVHVQLDYTSNGAKNVQIRHRHIFVSGSVTTT